MTFAGCAVLAACLHTPPHYRNGGLGMRNLTLSAAIAALLLGAGTASAHHAFSQDFDENKPVTISGTVTKVQWAHPHVMTYIDVKDDTGKVTNWKVEMGNPTQLTKVGWTRTKL